MLNTMLVKSTPSDMYAAGSVFLLDTRHNVLLYYDFGHTPVYVLRKVVRSKCRAHRITKPMVFRFWESKSR